MKKYKVIFFWGLMLTYFFGVALGGIGQVRQKNPADMYLYLEKAVAEYEATPADGIIKIARENLILFGACAIGAIIKAAVPAIALCLFARGYAAGFAITSVLRLYGLKGALLSAANIISLSFVIPLLCLCGSAAIENIAENRFDRKRFFKCGFILVIFMGGIFVADCVLRGGLSAVFTNFAAGVLK